MEQKREKEKSLLTVRYLLFAVLDYLVLGYIWLWYASQT